MILETERLLLRPLSERELDGPYVSWLNDPEVCRYNSHGDAPYTLEAAKKFIDSTVADASCEVYAVYMKSTGLHVGNISLQRINKKNRSAEIAFLFGDKRYWGCGYASEAGERLLRRAFDDLVLHRIYFGTHIDNLGMQKVGEKIGFVKEGVMKDAQLKNGQYNDIVIYGIINNTSKGAK